MNPILVLTVLGLIGLLAFKKSSLPPKPIFVPPRPDVAQPEQLGHAVVLPESGTVWTYYAIWVWNGSEWVVSKESMIEFPVSMIHEGQLSRELRNEIHTRALIDSNRTGAFTFVFGAILFFDMSGPPRFPPARVWEVWDTANNYS